MSTKIETTISPFYNPTALHNGINAAISNGYGVARGVLPDTRIEDLTADSQFRIYPSDGRYRGLGTSRRPVLFNPQTWLERRFLSTRGRHTMRDIGRILTMAVAEVNGSRDEPLESLTGWEPNKVTVNRMKPELIPNSGSSEKRANLYRHRDPPRFKGLIFSAALNSGEVTTFPLVGDRILPHQIPMVAGDIGVYACADLCAEVGIPQTEHEVMTKTPHLSVVFEHDTNTTPITLASGLQRLFGQVE